MFPELTEERRKEYIKVARTKAEDGRVSVRNIRRHAKQSLEKLEKDGEVGKDDVTGAEKRLDAITKKHTDTDRRPAQAQGSRAARGLSLGSLAADAHDRRPTHAAAGVPAAEGPRPRRSRPARAPSASAVVLLAAIAASLAFWKTAFMVIVAAAVVVAVWELHRGSRPRTSTSPSSR